MSVNLKDIDPAVVASAAEGSKPKQAPPPPAPKKEIPISAKILKGTGNEEDPEAPVKYEADLTANCLISTIDSKVVAVPRAVAAKMPVVSSILADQPAEAHIPIGTSASAAVAIAHWVEHVGSASGKSESAIPAVILFTDMGSFLTTEWEKDFDTRILTADSETLLRVTNFAEQNGMIGLLDFCVAAVSCAIRGKSNHEMMVALCVDGDELTQEELDAGKAAYPWAGDITKPHVSDE